MLRISIVDTRSQRRLVVEGKLVPPWTTELRTAYDNANTDLGSRELVVDVKNLTVISHEGEDLLAELMNQGAQFRVQPGNIVPGVFTPVLAKHSKRFSLEDALSIGVDRMQRNFEPMRQQVEGWRAAAIWTGSEADDLPCVHRGRA